MTEIYRPIDVLDKQVELVRYWRSNPTSASFDKAFAHLMNRYRLHDGTTGDGTLRSTKDGRTLTLSQFLASRLDVAETIFVRSNIITKLWNFTGEFEAHERETITYQDLPCDRGFAYLEQCIHIMDVKGKINSIRAILWDTEPEGVILVPFSDSRDPLDDINRQAQEEWGANWFRKAIDLPPLHVQSYRYGTKIQNLTLEDFQERGGNSLRPTEEAEKNVEYENRFNKFLISLWEFMQQQLPYRVPANRPMLRRLQRAHSPLTDVSIIQLRTQEQPYRDPEGDPQFVAWSHRWRVREHKRRWIDKKTGELRETTISSHVKGPEHLPLIEKDRVFHVKK